MFKYLERNRKLRDIKCKQKRMYALSSLARMLHILTRSRYQVSL